MASAPSIRKRRAGRKRTGGMLPVVSSEGMLGELRNLSGPSRHEVDEDVLAQPLRRRIEGASAVEPGHERNELGQRPGSLEHERVDRDPLLRAALDLAEGLLDR